MGDFPLRPEDFIWRYDEDHTFDFYEDENANVWGYGHKDKAEFAEAVNGYDRLVCGEDYDMTPHDAADVAHLYAVLVDGDRFTFKDITPETPGAVAITGIWNVR